MNNSKTLYIVGAGAVGSSLGYALASCGWHVVGVCDTCEKRAESLAEVLGTRACGALNGEVTAANAVMIAVSDSAISGVAEQAKEQGAFCSEQIWFHVSGAKQASALVALEGRVRAVGAIHPAHVFAPEKLTKLRPGLSFGVDGDETLMAFARLFASDLGGHVVNISGANRPAYHAATVMASNYVVALIAEARDVLVSFGIDKKEAESLIVALALSGTEYAAQSGVNDSLSGPVRRGDSETVSSHLKALQSLPDLLLLYQSLGRSTVRLTKEIGQTDKGALSQISNLLQKKMR